MENQKVTIGIGGNVRIGHELDMEMAHKGYLFPWGDLFPYLKSTDFNLINLETSFTTSHHQSPEGEVFKAALDKVETLANANIAVANLANTHVMDFFSDGMLETIRILDEVHVKHSGAGKESTSAWHPAFIQRQGLVSGVLGVSLARGDWMAKSESPGLAFVDIQDPGSKKDLLFRVEQLRSKVNFLIVSVYWDLSPTSNIPDNYIKFAQELLDAGADVVNGCTEHFIKEMEVYKGKLIIYGTGNLLEGYNDGQERKDNRSIFVTLELEGSKVFKVRAIPITNSNGRISCSKTKSYSWTMMELESLPSKLDLPWAMNGHTAAK